MLTELTRAYNLQDVAAYDAQVKNTTGTRPPVNAVALLMRIRALAVQGAVNVVGGMVRDSFARFLAAAARVRALVACSERPARVSLAWVLGGGASAGLGTHGGGAVVESAERYITALGDCIVGVIHWVYESELFFGTRGAEIRSFGWVFVDERTA